MPRVTTKSPFLIAGAAIALSVSAISTMGVQQGINKRREVLRHSVDVFKSCDRVFSNVRDMETGQRGYLLTGIPHYLKPYQDSQSRFDTDLEQYEGFVQSKEEKANFKKVERVSRDKIKELAETIQLHDSGEQEKALSLVKTDVGKSHMDELSFVLDGLRSRQDKEIMDFRDTIDNRTSALTINFLLTMLFTMTCLGLSIAKYLSEKEHGRRNYLMLQNFKKMQGDWHSKMEESLSYDPWKEQNSMGDSDVKEAKV